MLARRNDCFSDCSFDATVYGFKKGLHLSHEGRESADHGRHGSGTRATSYEAKEFPGTAGARRPELRGGALYRIHQKLATHR